jgi:small-conductance mechanosensitive channel
MSAPTRDALPPEGARASSGRPSGGSWKDRAPLLAAALWWGSLTAVGFIAVPLLFANLPTATAGHVAARLFTGQTWTSIGCGMLVLIAARSNEEGSSLDWGRGAIGFVIAGLLLAILGEFAVAPHIVARQDLAFWHTAGTAFYALQWVCALVVLWKVSARTS